MESTRAEIRAMRDRSMERVRRTTLVVGATAAVTGGVLAVGLAGQGHSPTAPANSAQPSQRTLGLPVGESDDGGDDDGTTVVAQVPVQQPAGQQGGGSVTTSGGS